MSESGGGPTLYPIARLFILNSGLFLHAHLVPFRPRASAFRSQRASS